MEDGKIGHMNWLLGQMAVSIRMPSIKSREAVDMAKHFSA
jgi:hypothetical protein